MQQGTPHIRRLDIDFLVAVVDDKLAEQWAQGVLQGSRQVGSNLIVSGFGSGPTNDFTVIIFVLLQRPGFPLQVLAERIGFVGYYHCLLFMA